MVPAIVHCPMCRTLRGDSQCSGVWQDCPANSTPLKRGSPSPPRIWAPTTLQCCCHPAMLSLTMSPAAGMVLTAGCIRVMSLHAHAQATIPQGCLDAPGTGRLSPGAVAGDSACILPAAGCDETCCGTTCAAAAAAALGPTPQAEHV